MLTSIRILLARIQGLVGGSRRDDELRAEIQAHLNDLESHYVTQGLSAEDARLAARRTFGGIDQVRALHREQRGLPFVDALWQDIRFAIRLLVRDRGFTFTAILVLGLGIGINAMQFTVFDAHLLRGLPIHQPDRVLYVSTFDERQPDRGVSYLDFEDLRRDVTTYSGLAAYTAGAAVLGDEGRAPERRNGARMSANAFDQLRIRPVTGRGFLPEEDREGAAPVAVITEALWSSRYGGDPALVGRSILIDGVPTTVVGVLADESGFPSVAEVFRPLGQTPGLMAQGRDVRTLRVFGRLADGVEPAQAGAEIEGITERLARDHADTSAGNRARVVPINERFLGTRQPQWYAFLSAGILIAAISAANVANLMLARSIRRRREIAVRTSLGATRARIVRQLLVESGVLAILGGAVGFVIASAGVRLFANAVPAGLLPYWFHYEMDLRAFTALMAIALGTVLVFGLIPALHTSRTDVNRTIKDTTGSGAPREARRWRTAFLTAELALAIVMLANLALAMRLPTRTPADRTVDTAAVLTASVTLPAGRYAGAEERRRFFERLQDNLEQLPGVTSASVASHLPAAGAVEHALAVNGRAGYDVEAPRVHAIAIAPRYLETLGVGVLRGRALEEGDGSPGRENTIVNERFAELFFPGENPIERQIALTAPDAPEQSRHWFTIVGVTPNLSLSGSLDIAPIAYTPISTVAPPTASLLVRSDVDAARLSPLVRSTVASLDPELFIFRVLTMDLVVYETAWSGRLGGVLIAMFTIIAVALAGVGLYAITAHQVGLRTREIGLRMALGATRGRIWRLVLRGGLVRVALAAGMGLLATMAWERAFETSGATGVRLTDPYSLALAVLVLLVISMGACFIPARRATRMEPVAALRQE